MSFKKYVELREMAVANFGKHQGKHINDIDSGYATWLLKSIKDSGKVLGNFLADDGSGKLSKDQIIQALEIRSRNKTVAPTSTNEPIRASGSVPKAPKDDFFLDPSMKEYWLSRYSPYHRLLFDIMKELYQTMEKESSKLPSKSNFPQYFIESGFDLTELLSRLNPNDKNYEPNEAKRKEYKSAYDLITKRNTGESSYVDVYRDGRSPDQWKPESSSTRTPTTLTVASRAEGNDFTPKAHEPKTDPVASKIIERLKESNNVLSRLADYFGSAYSNPELNKETRAKFEKQIKFNLNAIDNPQADVPVLISRLKNLYKFFGSIEPKRDYKLRIDYHDEYQHIEMLLADVLGDEFGDL